MVAKLMNQVLQAMSQTLGSQQLERLKDVLDATFKDVELIEKCESKVENDLSIVSTFLSAKRVEGCSEKSMLAFHVLVNVGMTMGIMPVTGIPLPLMSYGVSSLTTNVLAVALLLNIHLRKQKLVF